MILLVSFLVLGLLSVVLASVLDALGGPSMDVNSVIGAIVLVATALALAVAATMWGRPEGPTDTSDAASQ
ncbi:MAG: hypothetical protein JOZ41_22390 [Chloroflexi bacterium]|nr:hypothetical protein [Chloroflexota bacterium]